MNIQEAKLEIKRSVSIYLMKDEFGNYRIPLERQRPIFMIGAPGIGKTAIMAQIARELNISLVSYSMTHHTRQSALGLPFIVHKTYEGKEFDVSEYTLSEILATVYECMQNSGKKEGILFLDEINCVSETLGPSMLQFLQYKTFGNHRLPDGWVVVTAGNPAEYNKSVHEFDVATLDRLKVLHVDPDYSVWKKYAEENNLHKAITTFLDIHQDDFYKIETTVEGRNYVTARGWEDLSEALKLYEERGFPVDEVMIHEYLSDDETADDFSSYYALFRKYQSDYQVREILSGNTPAEIRSRASQAPFDERVSVTALLLDALIPSIQQNMETEDSLRMLRDGLRMLKERCSQEENLDVNDTLENASAALEERIAAMEAGNSLNERDRRIYQYQISFYRKNEKSIEMHHCENAADAFKVIADDYSARVHSMKEEASHIADQLHQMFVFLEENYGQGQEMLIALTQLSANVSCARFIAEHDCSDYYRNAEKMSLEGRSSEIQKRIETWAEEAGKEDSLSI